MISSLYGDSEIFGDAFVSIFSKGNERINDVHSIDYFSEHFIVISQKTAWLHQIGSLITRRASEDLALRREDRVLHKLADGGDLSIRAFEWKSGDCRH